MKKFKYILVFTMCLLMGVSCSDQLEPLPTNLLGTDIVLVDATNFELYTKGVYGQLRGYYSGIYTILPDVMSDNLIIKQNGRKSLQNYYLLLTNSETTWGSIRDGGHNVIFSANQALAQLDVLENGDFKDNIQGELLALRGMAHFDIAKVFAKTPSIGSASDMGIIYRETTTIGDNDSRLNLSESYAKIIADLEAAKALIGTDNGASRLNKYAVAGILSRVYLYMGDWANARDNAQFVLDNSPYEVTPRVAFDDLWDNVYNQSSVFKIVIDNADGIEMGVNYGQTGPTGTKSEYVPDFGFYNMYTTTDVRKNAYFETSAFEGSTYNHVIKYKQRPGSSANIADIPVLRMDEVVLNLAEAQSNLNSDAAALAALDMLRSERYSDYAAGSEAGTALKAAILMERRLELAFEGHRLFDVKRLGTGFLRTAAGDLSDGSGTNPPSFATGLEAGNIRFQFPYAQRSIDINPNLQQNPGY
jgi:hypothetical protein